jgi:hypothetical protein
MEKVLSDKKVLIIHSLLQLSEVAQVKNHQKRS